MEKELSIIVPHYNTPKMLDRLLSTIPNDPEIEVLVIDDTSDRELEEFKKCVDKYSKRNISFYSNSLDQKGAGGARNLGIEHARGKWILFADADDYFLDDFFQIIKRNYDDQFEIIFFTPVSIVNDTGYSSERHIYYENLIMNYIENSDYINELKLRYTYWSPCSKLIKKSLIDNYKIRFDNSRYSNDIMFSAKIGAYAYKIKACIQNIYCITETQGSLTNIKDATALLIRKKVFKRYYFFLLKKLNWKDMKSLGYGVKDFIYFCAFHMGMVK